MEQCQQNSKESKRDVLLEVGLGTRLPCYADSHRESAISPSETSQEAISPVLHEIVAKEFERCKWNMAHNMAHNMSRERFSRCLSRFKTRKQLLWIICVMAQKHIHMPDSIKYSFIIITNILDLCPRSRKCVIPVVCVKLGKMYVVKHNCVTWGVFNDYIMDNYMFRPVLVIFRLS